MLGVIMDIVDTSANGVAFVGLDVIAFASLLF
jgi:hypothetical protein